MSRSGATRAAARARGFGRADAAALSREVALPVLAGAAALKGFRLARRRPPPGELRALARRRRRRRGLDVRRRCAPSARWPPTRRWRRWAAYRTALAVAVLAVWQDRAR